MNRSCSIFNHLFQLFSRVEFLQAVKETQAERHARGFTCWGQFVAMLFGQLGRAHSLIEIVGGLRSCEGKLKHPGSVLRTVRPWLMPMSTVSGDYTKKSSCSCCTVVKPRCRAKKKFRFKNKLVSLDSTTIDLSVTLFDWAKFRRTKGAIKLHLLLDHDGYLPTFAMISEGKMADIKKTAIFSAMKPSN